MAYTNKVITIVGQSNATGRVPMATLPYAYTSAANTGQFFPNRIWTGANYGAINSSLNNNQYVETANQYGCQFYLGDYAAQLYRDIYLLQYALGGTSLATLAGGGTASNWNTATAASLFVTWKSIIQDTKTKFEAKGKLYNFDAILWMQGNADCDDLTAANSYSANLNALYSAINTEIGQADSPIWIIPKMNSQLLAPYITTINAAYETLRAANPTKVFLLDTDDYGYLDLAHYSDTGFRMFADDVIELLNLHT